MADKCNNCKNVLFKCNSEKCDNYSKVCRKCNFDIKTNTEYLQSHMSSFYDHTTPYRELYKICCGICGYGHDLLIKHNGIIPIISEMYKNVEINITLKK